MTVAMLHRRVILRKVASRREADQVTIARRLVVADREKAELVEEVRSCGRHYRGCWLLYNFVLCAIDCEASEACSRAGTGRARRRKGARAEEAGACMAADGTICEQHSRLLYTDRYMQVAVSEERAETAAREAANEEQSKAALPHVRGDHLRLTVRTPNGAQSSTRQT